MNNNIADEMLREMHCSKIYSMMFKEIINPFWGEDFSRVTISFQPIKKISTDLLTNFKGKFENANIVEIFATEPFPHLDNFSI